MDSSVITLEQCGVGACDVQADGTSRCQCGCPTVVYLKTSQKGHELIQCTGCRKIIGDFKLTRKRNKIKWYA